MTIDKFESFVFPEPNTGCFLWGGRINNQGYGIGHFGSGIQLAHRFSMFLHSPLFRNNLWVLHKCDNPLCVNPDHLFMGTPADNSHDRDKKGRQKTKHGTEHKCCKLTDAQVREIRRLYVPFKYPSRRLAREFGVSQQKIMHIIKNKSWRHLLS